jgi:8-oxo-dGTP diphosphatase
MTMPGEPEPYDAREFPPRAVTVDIVVFTVHKGRLLALMLERGAQEQWYPGQLALPGSFVGDEENLEQAAVRVLWEKTGLDLPMHTLDQFGAYGDPDRDPRMRVISIGFMGLIPAAMVDELDDDFDDADPYTDLELERPRRWMVIDDLIKSETAQVASVASVAFDHLRILQDARDRLQVRVEETDAALDLLPEMFTLAQLREVYEAIWGMAIDPGNFAKRIGRVDGFIEPIDAASLSPSLESLLESSNGSPPESPESPVMERRVFLSAPIESKQWVSMSMAPPDEDSTPSRPRGRPPKWYVRGGVAQLHPPLRRPGSYFIKPRRSS